MLRLAQITRRILSIPIPVSKDLRVTPAQGFLLILKAGPMSGRLFAHRAPLCLSGVRSVKRARLRDYSDAAFPPSLALKAPFGITPVIALSHATTRVARLLRVTGLGGFNRAGFAEG